MWLFLGVSYACVCLSLENICTKMSRFPQLNTNYTVVGQPIEAIAAGGLLGCVLKCQLKATCEAFTYHMKTRDCNMYDQFEYSSPNNINGNGVVTSIIGDWNLTQNDSRLTRQTLNKGTNVRRKTDLIPGQDCTMPGVTSNGYLTQTRPFYNGTINVTISGKACQRWDDHTFHRHVKGTTPYHFNTGESMSEVANYCRIVLPDSYDTPWCYTTHSQRWDKCNVSECT